MTLSNVRNDITTLKWMAGVNLSLSLATLGAVLAMAFQPYSIVRTSPGPPQGSRRRAAPLLFCSAHRAL